MQLKLDMRRGHWRWLNGSVFLLFGALLIIAPGSDDSALAAASPEIVKSPNDPRQYEFITLPNQLQALIISSPDSDKAAASLAVNVGSNDDPEGREGLTHFLEHMLFLGTEKYPQPGEYKQFISSHSGSDNAYTAADHTNYYFDVDKNYLEPALERFSRFFIDPLFIAKYVDNERQIVHSEYQSKLKSDGWRVRSAQRLALNPKHPMSRFNIGSLETLADRPGSDIRTELIDFYRRHYSANLMSLVVLGKEPLPQLRQWVMEKFSPVENRNVAALQIDEPLFLPGQLPARLNVVPIKDERNLTLAFPVPSNKPYYRQKPINYIAHLLGHEGKGSLLSLLKDKGWADGIWAGLANADERQDMVTVSVQLTESGLDQVDTVIGHVFQYLRLVRRQGVTAWIFDEQKRLAEINFRFQERGEPISYVRSLAAAMREYPPADLLRGPYAMDEYDALLIKRYLDDLRPDNVLVTVSAPGLPTDAVEPWFEVAYSLTPISAEMQQRWGTEAIAPGLAIPEPNQFIPDNVTLKDGTNANEKPALLETQFEFWYQQDDTYHTPRTEFYFTVRSPLANNSPRHAMLTELYVKVVSDLLSEFSYPAYLAGLEYRLYKHIRGFTVRISGYSDKQPLLLERIMAMLTQPAIDVTRFELIKADLLRDLQNASQDAPFRQLLSEVTDLLIKPYWSEQESIAALQPLNAADLERFIPQLLAEIEVVALANGNLDRAEALSLATILQDNLLAHAKKITVPKGKLLKLEPQSVYVRQLDIDHDDSALAVYFQGDEQSEASRMTFALLGQMLESPFFEEIRTEKRLGYTVFAYPMPLLQVPGLMFVVQSPVADPVVLEQHVQDFIVSYADTLAAMGETEFNKHKQALSARILEKEKTLKERSDRYWTEIDRQDYDFDSRQKMHAALAAISKDDIVDAYRQFLLGDSRRRLVLRSIGAKHTAVFTRHSDGDGEKLIIDPALFKSGREVFSG